MELVKIVLIVSAIIKFFEGEWTVALIAAVLANIR
jgi:hypothetical protein